MGAYHRLQSIIETTIVDKNFKQVSPIMYDEVLLSKKVSVLIFQEDENKRLVRKLKITVRDDNWGYNVHTEEIPMNHKFTS